MPGAGHRSGRSPYRRLLQDEMRKSPPKRAQTMTHAITKSVSVGSGRAQSRLYRIDLTPLMPKPMAGLGVCSFNPYFGDYPRILAGLWHVRKFWAVSFRTRPEFGSALCNPSLGPTWRPTSTTTGCRPRQAPGGDRRYHDRDCVLRDSDARFVEQIWVAWVRFWRSANPVNPL